MTRSTLTQYVSCRWSSGVFGLAYVRVLHQGWHEQKHEDLISSVHAALNGCAEKFKGMGHKLEDIKGVGEFELTVSTRTCRTDFVLVRRLDQPERDCVCLEQIYRKALPWRQCHCMA